MKRQLSLVIGLILLAPACTDPEPQPLPPPTVGMNNTLQDMGGGMSDMATPSDMEAPSDMAANMTTPPADMGMAEDMGVDMSADMGVDMGVDMCEPKSEVDLCAEYNFECGKLEVMECGVMRVVENCGGGCPAPSLCEQMEADGAITGSVCRCDESNGAQICDNVGKLCGQIDNLPPGVCDTLPACNAYCVDSMEAGNNFNCAIGSGKLRCWGENRGGQLGLGDTTARKNPDDQIALSLPVLQVAAGGAHTCAILEDRSLICWGENGTGQLGVGTSVSAKAPDLSDANSRAFPKDTGIAKVVTGDEHTCALIDTDYTPGLMGVVPQGPYSVYCWGTNELGIVGNTNYAVNSTIGVPVLVDGLLDNVYDIAAGSQHTCAIVDAGDANNPAARDVVCWGAASEGQNGSHAVIRMADRTDYPYIDTFRDGVDRLFYPAPVKVQDPGFEEVITISQENGNLNTFFPPQTGHPFRGEFKAITSGRTYSCVRDGNDEVWCWGMMPFDHARGTCEDPNKETEPGDCTIWPPNDLWPNNNASRVWPVVPMVEQTRQANMNNNRRVETSGNKVGLPAGGLDYIAVAARPIRVAFQADPLSLPTGISPSANVKATHFAAHNEHLCMLVEEQNTAKTNVYCLGHNQFGEVGNGTNSPTKFASPIRGDVNGNVVRATQLSLGDRHSCAVVDDNNIKCWGSNRASQIGNENLLQDESFRPFDVLLR